MGKGSFFLTMSSFFAPPKLVNIEKTLPTSWVLIICGDLPEPVTVIIPDPHQWTVTRLKTEVEKKTQIPVNEQTIYFGETPLLDIMTPLAKYEGLRNGIALCLARSNFVITAQRTDYGTTVEVSIPRSELESWTVKMLRKYICLKFGFRIESKHYLISGPNIIENDRRKITDCPEITDGCTLLFTPLKEISIASPEQELGGKCVHVPPAMPLDFLSTTVYNSRPFSADLKNFQTDEWIGSWSLNVVKVKTSQNTGQLTSRLQIADLQPLGWITPINQGPSPQANLTSLESGLANLQTSSPAPEVISIPKRGMTPVFELRQIICNKLSIEPIDQKIFIDETILEDWDDEGRPLLLRNYPTIHDGATIFLEVEVKTSGGFGTKWMIQDVKPVIINLKYPSKKPTLLPSRKNLSFPVLSSERIIPPSSINIHNPDKMTQDTLAQIVSQCEGGFGFTSGIVSCLYIKRQPYGQFEKFDIIKNSTVDRIALQMGCTVSSRDTIQKKKSTGSEMRFSIF